MELNNRNPEKQNMSEQWYALKSEFGGILFRPLKNTSTEILKVGQAISADSVIARSLDEVSSALTVLIVCDDAQNNLLSGLDALEDVSGTSTGELIGTVAKLIEAARKVT